MGALRTQADREAWKTIFGLADEIVQLAIDPTEVMDSLRSPEVVWMFRDQLRNRALRPFAVEGASLEDARLAFVQLGKAVLTCGLPDQRRRLATALAVLTAEMRGIMADHGAALTAESLRRAGVAD